jgi:ParB/RepB/Spo0J family partition protein
MIMILKTNQEYASLVPELSTEEYESLKQSIKENGLWIPIVVNKDGVILDGHHRYKACQELGVKEPYKTVIKEFEDELHEKMFVINCNLTRRQLNNFQRTEVALKSKSILEEIVKQNESQGGKGVHNCY